MNNWDKDLEVEMSNFVVEDNSCVESKEIEKLANLETVLENTQNMDIEVEEEEEVIFKTVGKEVVKAEKDVKHSVKPNFEEYFKILMQEMKNMSIKMEEKMEKESKSLKEDNKSLIKNMKEDMNSIKEDNNIRFDSLTKDMKEIKEESKSLKEEMKEMKEDNNIKLDSLKLEILKVEERNQERLERKFYEFSESTIKNLRDQITESIDQCRINNSNLTCKIDDYKFKVDVEIGDIKNQVSNLNEDIKEVKSAIIQTKGDIKNEIEQELVEKFKSIDVKKVDENKYRSRVGENIKRIQKDIKDHAGMIEQSSDKYKEILDKNLDEFRKEQKGYVKQVLEQMDLEGKIQQVYDQIEMKSIINAKTEMFTGKVNSKAYVDYVDSSQVNNIELIKPSSNNNNQSDNTLVKEIDNRPSREVISHEGSSNNSMALRFMKVKPFKGEYMENPSEFLNNLDELFSICSLSEKEKVAVCSNHLYGIAKDWWQSLFEKPITYGDFKCFIVGSFWNSDKQDCIRYQITQDKYQVSKGSYTSFFRSQAVRLKTLTACPLSEGQIVRIVRHNLPKHVEQLLIAADRGTIEEVSEILDALEVAELSVDNKFRINRDKNNYPLASLSINTGVKNPGGFKRSFSYKGKSRMSPYFKKTVQYNTNRDRSDDLHNQPSTSGVTTILQRPDNKTGNKKLN